MPVKFEYWTASSHHDPLHECLDRVTQTDVVVVLVAECYGWEPEDQLVPNAARKSITWLECERAKREGKEILSFFVEAPDWPDQWKEDYELRQKLQTEGDLRKLLCRTQHKVQRLNTFKDWLRSLGIRACPSRKLEIVEILDIFRWVVPS